jgi:hypothetical protein
VLLVCLHMRLLLLKRLQVLLQHLAVPYHHCCPAKRKQREVLSATNTKKQVCDCYAMTPKCKTACFVCCRLRQDLP